MVKLFSLKSPDEWATTKQACRDTYVVTCFLPSTIRIYIYIYVVVNFSSQVIFVFLSFWGMVMYANCNKLCLDERVQGFN